MIPLDGTTATEEELTDINSLEEIEIKSLMYHQGKQIAIIGSSFSSEKRNISAWKGELLSEQGKFIKELRNDEKKTPLEQ